MLSDRDDEPLWYAIQVKAKREPATGELLRFKGYDVFLPQSRDARTGFGRKPVSSGPLFPGYLFLRVREHVVGLVVTTPGVIRIVGMAGHPLPIDAAEIHAIQIATQAGLHCCSHSYHAIGETVEINDGVLSGLRGIVLRHTPPKQVLLSVSLIGASIAVNIDPALL